MVQLRQATARLRLFLAEIHSREEQLDSMIRQFRTQLNRLPRQAMYGRTTLDMVLSSMAEIQERLNYTQVTKQHLLAIKQRATDELSALELTRKVEEAKEALKDLKSGSDGAANVDEGVVAEMRRLEEFIAEYSKQAERAITSSFQEGHL
jgi:chromosome segregation ATPase